VTLGTKTFKDPNADIECGVCLLDAISPWLFHGFSQVTTHIAFQAARTGNLVRAHWEPPEGIGF